MTARSPFSARSFGLRVPSAYGVQEGRVALQERQLRVVKPRLRKRRSRADESGDAEIPAYTALQADQGLADRMLQLVMNGVSTRRYASVLPEMADQVGISKSEVSRETIEAGMPQALTGSSYDLI